LGIVEQQKIRCGDFILDFTDLLTDFCSKRQDIGFRVRINVRVKASAPICISRECTYLLVIVLHVSAYAVLRAMRQVDGGGSFSATWGSETTEPIQLKFGMFDYIRRPTPHAKYGCHRKRGGVGWDGYMGEVVPLYAFFIFFP